VIEPPSSRVPWVVSAVNALTALGLLLLFVRAYSSPFPISDEWFSSLPVATKACEGTLAASDLLQVTGGGHRTLFTHVQTALDARIFGWRLDREVFLGPLLGCGSFLLLILLLRRHAPELAAPASIPLAWLVFSFYQHLNWIMSWQSAWHYANLFVIAAVVVLTLARPGWPALAGAVALAACATFSRSHGMVAWPALCAVLWMRGFSLAQRLAWFAAGAGAVALYLRGSGITLGGSRSSSWNNLDPTEPLRVAHTVLSQLGAPMGGGRYALATAVGALGLLWLAVNAVHVWRRLGAARGRETLAPWIALAAFAVGCAAMVGAARMVVMSEVGLSLWGGYSTTAILLWVAVSVVALAAMRGGSRSRPLAIGNLAALLLLVPLYVVTHLGIVREWNDYYGTSLLAGKGRYAREVSACILEFPVRGERDCLGVEVAPYIRPSGEEIHRLAALRLAVFADDVPLSILPANYDAASPVLVGTQSELLNVYARDQMLPNVLPELAFHVVPPRAALAPGGTVEPPRNRTNELTSEVVAELRAAAAATGTVWYVGTSDVEPTRDELARRLAEAGFAGERIVSLPPRYAGGSFEVWRFSTSAER
jgi:hypothetical protein